MLARCRYPYNRRGARYHPGVIWGPFLLALALGLIVSAGLYFAYMWPSVEPVDAVGDDAVSPAVAASEPTETAKDAADASSAPSAPSEATDAEGDADSTHRPASESSPA